MKKLLLLFALVLTVCSTAMAQGGPARNEIWYTSSDGQIVVPNAENAFGVSITGNTYTGGKGCITFSGDMTHIGEGAFKGCKTLTTFTVPEGLATVGTSAFQDCCRLKQITFPSSVTSIGTSAFSGCDDLVLVKLLGSSVPWTRQTFVNSGANVGGKTFLVPEEAVADYVNSGWSPTYSSTLAGDALESLKTTAQAAMENATNAESALTDGDKASIATYKSNVGSATNIEDLLNERAKAFYVISLRKAKTTALNAISEAEANVTEPLTDAEKASVNLCKENIENGTDIAAVRQETTKAKMILLKTRVIIYTSSDGQVIPVNSSAFGELTIVSNEYDKEMGKGCITFSGDVTSIGLRAFFWCENLTSVTIPDLVTSIGDDAFCNCVNLTSVTIPDLVKSIGFMAFRNCINLKSLSVPNVTSIGDEAFYGCYFSSLVTNENLNAKENNYWGATMCNGDGVAINDNIVVDCAPWATSVTIPDGITGIGDYAFYGCSGIKGNLVIPSSLASIGDCAFYGCSGLTSVSLPRGVTSIGEEAFYECTGIKGALVIPSTVTSIGGSAFDGCNNLTSLTVKGGSIGLWAFSGCYGLTSVSLQEGVTSIGYGAFQSCSGIKGDLVIPSTVTSVGTEAFSGCSGIEGTLVIPSSVTSIGWRAFEGCNKLTSIHSLALLPPSLGKYTFESVPKDIPVYVFDVNAYATAEVWNEFTNFQLIKYFKLGGTTYLLDDDGKFVDGELTFTDKDEYLSYRDFTVEELTYTRTFDNTNWQALYVPFSIDYEEWSEKFDIAKIHNFIEYDDDDNGEFDRTYLVVLKLTSGRTKPNYPYLIRAKETGTHSLVLQDKTLGAAKTTRIDCRSVENEYTFTGTYAKIADMYASGYYALAGGALNKAKSADVTLNPQRWYMEVTSRTGGSSTKAHSIRILVDGEEGIMAPSTSPKGESPVVYDLQGRAVGTTTKYQRGINIVNGKKIIK